MSDVRVRFAPSPTGLLHIGGLRTALYNYLFARKHGGTFVLRIEDTDRERFVEEAEPDIRSSLTWAGLEADEGPDRGGPSAPYYQSQRGDIYHQYAQQLVDAGHAYHAFDTPEALDEMRARLQSDENPSPRYDAASRMSMQNALTLPMEEVHQRIERGEPHVVRLKVDPERTVRFEDAVRGWVSFEGTEMDDQVLVKSDGMPTYHLANVVDDHLMKITHVIRGEEWLPSTPKHVLLYEYLGWEVPEMAHLPLILSPNGGKLSKRNADELGIPVSVRDYREEGYEPAALLNFLAFLGWNPGTEQEVFTLDELVEAFTLDRVGSSGVQFNLEKLRWYNGQFLRRAPVEDLVDRIRPLVRERGWNDDASYLAAVVRLLQERVSFAEEIVSTGHYFFEDPDEYDEKGVSKRWKADSPEVLAAYADRLEGMEELNADQAESALRALAEARGIGAGRIIHPTRLALTGVTAGPGLFDLMSTLGKEVCVRRIRRVIEALG